MTTYPKARPYQTAMAHGARSGAVVSSGRAVRDDVGIYTPLGTSFFWAHWGWEHDRQRTEDNLKYLAAWADYTRAFGEVGGPSWEDRTINPMQSNYEDIWKDYLDTAWGTYGVRTGLTIFAGGSGANTDLTVQKIINIVRGREEAIQWLEGANEAFQNFQDEDKLRRVVQRLRGEFPTMLIGTSSPPAVYTQEAFDLDIANTLYLHSERQPGDEDWRQVRQGCEIMPMPTTGDNNEPPGFESSEAVLEDPLRLGCLAAVGYLSGMPQFVLHTGAGIRGGGRADLARGRKSNLWEYGSRLEDAVVAIRIVTALMPPECPNWRKMKGHWAEAILKADMVWSDDPNHYDHGLVRIYGAYTDREFINIAFGVKKYVELTVQHGNWHITCYDALTGQPGLVQTFQQGQMFRLSSDQPGSNKAFVIAGSAA